jgi:hypothetical protein
LYRCQVKARWIIFLSKPSIIKHCIFIDYISVILVLVWMLIIVSVE